MDMNMLAVAETVQLVGDLGVGLGILGASLGTALVVIGAAKGIGTIAGNSVESIARQPEAGGRIFTTMIISAALIEGFTFFAIVVCLLGVGNLEKLAKLSLGITE